MAEFESKINLNVDSTQAIAAIKILQDRISAFHSSMAKSGGFANAQLAKMRTNLINSINATGSFRASMTEVVSATESFTTALEKNKLSMGETFRYTMGATKTFGRFFKNEMDLINKVARERTKTIQTSYLKMGRDANGAMQAIKVRPLVLDLKNLETQMMMNAQRIQVMNKLIDHGSTQLLNFGKNTQWAGRQLMVGFTVPLTMLGTVAAKTFMEMEKEVIKLRRVYGDFSTTVQDTDKMVASIKELATEFTKFGVAAKDTMALAAEAAAAGAQGTALINQVTQASRLAVLGQVDQQQAYETTISITNAFGIATEELAGKIDFLNAVENQTVTSISDLTEAIPKAAPVIKQLGGNVQDLAFFLTAMKEGGINASEGANALKSGLASIINPTQKAKDQFAGLGISLDNIVSSNAGNVKGMVIDLGKALDDLDPTTRAQAIEQLFGKFQFSRISTLLQNVTKSGTQAQKVLGLANASASELAVMSKRELDKVQSSTTFKFQAAWEKFQQALAPVGEQFLKAVTPILDFGTKLLTQFNNWSDGAKNFAIGLTAALGVVGPTLLMAVGLVSNGIANLMKFFAFLSRAFTGATKDSSTLGMETRYMTEAQLNAAAAATSLGQTHSKLQQIYTSETDSLIALTSALNRAVAAQERFGAAGGGALTKRGGKAKTPVPKKYAEGVVMVPGPKGAGDVVPAMLSPGEAVIPAKMAQKYSGLITGMIAGNVPGYAEGKDPKVMAPSSYGTTESTHFNNPNQFADSYTSADAKAEFEKQQAKLLKDKHISEEEYKSNVARFNASVDKNSNGKNVKLYTGNTVAIDKNINQAFAKGKTATGAEISSSFSQQGTGAFASQEQHLRKLGASEGTIKTVVEEMKKQMEKSFKGMGKEIFDEKRFAEVVEKGMKAAYAEVLKSDINKSEKQIVKRQQAIASSAAGFGYQGSDQNNKRSYTRKYISMPDAQVRTGRNAIGITKELLAELKASGAVGQDATAEQVKKDLKDKITKYAGGKDADKKAINEAWRKITDTKDPKTRAAEIKKILEEKIKAPSSKPAEAKQKPLPKPSGPRAKGFEQVQEGVWADEHGNTYKDGKYYDAQGKKTTAKDLAKNKAAMVRRPVGRKGFGAAGAGLAIAGAGLAAGTPVDKMMENAMMGSMAAMVIPDSAKKLPGLLGKLAKAAPLVITGFLIVKDAIDAFNEKMRKAVESGFKLANSFSTTNEKLSAMGEQLGTVGATEAHKFRNDAMVSGVVDEQSLSVGKTLMQSDVGKGIAEDVKTAFASLGRGGAINSLTSQLGMMISQGIMTPEQARSFAYAISKELGNMTISSEVNMRINSLVGPNGERLESEPLKVALDIQSMNLKSLDMAKQAAEVGGQDSSVAQGNAVGRGLIGGAGVATGAVGFSQGAKATIPLVEKVGSSILGKEFELTKTKLVTGTINKIADKAAAKMAGTIAKVTAERAARVAITEASGAALDATVIGAPIGIALNVLGAIDMALGVVEIAGAVNDYNKALEQNAKLGAYVAQQGINQIQQNEQLRDSVNAQYDKKIEELQAQLLITSDVEKRKQLEEDINKLLADRDAANKQITDSSKEISKEVFDTLKKDPEKTFGDTGLLQQQAAVSYKDDPIGLDAAKVALQGLKDSGLKDTDLGMTVGIQLAYKNMDPATATTLINAAKDNKELQTNYNLLFDAKGLQDSATILQLLEQGGLNADSSEYAAVIGLMADPNMDMKALESIANVASATGGKIQVNVDTTKQAQSMFDELVDMPDVISKSVAMDINMQTGGEYADILANWDQLSGDDKVMTKEAMIKLKLASDDAAVLAWAKENGKALWGDQSQMASIYRGDYLSSLNMDQGALDSSWTQKAYKTEKVPTSGGNGVDPELQRLQDQQEKKQKALDVISIYEDRINKKYDERKKALQEIADAQAEITAQQENQMDLADALSKGDIAAAARAAQKVQAEAAKNSIKNQQDSLENARQAELDNVSFRGMTRGGLEPELDKLKELIAIREYELAPKKNGGGSGTATKKTALPKPTAPPAGETAATGYWKKVKDNWEWQHTESPTVQLGTGINAPVKPEFKYEGYVKGDYGNYYDPTKLRYDSKKEDYYDVKTNEWKGKGIDTITGSTTTGAAYDAAKTAYENSPELKAYNTALQNNKVLTIEATREAENHNAVLGGTATAEQTALDSLSELGMHIQSFGTDNLGGLRTALMQAGAQIDGDKVTLKNGVQTTLSEIGTLVDTQFTNIKDIFSTSMADLVKSSNIDVNTATDSQLASTAANSSDSKYAGWVYFKGKYYDPKKNTVKYGANGSIEDVQPKQAMSGVTSADRVDASGTGVATESVVANSLKTAIIEANQQTTDVNVSSIQEAAKVATTNINSLSDQYITNITDGYSVASTKQTQLMTQITSETSAYIEATKGQISSLTGQAKTDYENSLSGIVTKMEEIKAAAPGATNTTAYRNAAKAVLDAQFAANAINVAEYGIKKALLGFANGGYISGQGGPKSDSILARVSNGEYVINAAAVDKVGVPFLDAINNMQGFATGGYVAKKPGMKSYATGGRVQNSATSSAGSVYNYSVTVNAVSGSNADDIARTVIRQIQAVESKRIGGR